MRINHKNCFVVVLCVMATGQVSAKTAEQIYAELAPSVVIVYGMRGNQPTQGSGVVIKPKLVATNCHVLGKQQRTQVKLEDQTKLNGTLWKADQKRDLCILHVPDLTAKAIPIASKSSVRTGQKVYAIGSPRGMEQTLTDGLVSALRADNEGRDLIQTSAAVSHGSSGGGLFNENGQLIGITTLSWVDAQNLNFAVPAEFLLNMVFPNEDAGIIDPVGIHLERLKKGLQSPSAPHFTDVNDRVAYLHWLGEMSDRLQGKMKDPQIRREFLGAVWYESKRAGLDPSMVLAVIQTESDFRKYFIGPKNDKMGYMGVPARWTQVVGDGDHSKLFHMATNLRYGCSILRMYLDEEQGDLYLALGRYRDQRGKPEYPNKILAAWKRWEYSGVQPAAAR